ncbi:MAG TPA: acyl carrier protein [Polyangiales bacterium]
MSTQEEVRDFIVHNFYVPEPQTLDDAASLIDAGIVDSTGVLELLAFVESEFAVHVDDREIVPENFGSIERISAFVERKHSKAA